MHLFVNGIDDDTCYVNDESVVRVAFEVCYEPTAIVSQLVKWRFFAPA